MGFLLEASDKDLFLLVLPVPEATPFPKHGLVTQCVPPLFRLPVVKIVQSHTQNTPRPSQELKGPPAMEVNTVSSSRL